MKKSKRTKKSNTWKIKQHRDQYFKKSKILGYRSRAAFKLIELNNKFKFIKKKYSFIRYRSLSRRMGTSCEQACNFRKNTGFRS